jgi:hypothetical protein
MIVAWLLKNWRLIAYALAAAVVIGFLLLVKHWHADSKELPLVKAELAAELICGEGSQCALKQAEQAARQQAISEQVIKGYEQELADIRSTPIPTRVIRVCRETSTGSVRVPADSGESPGTSSSELVPGSDEFDTRPLRELARRADEISGGYRWLRNRDEALATPPGKPE